MNKPCVLYCTTNPGKLTEARNFFGELKTEVKSPKELGIEIEVEEDGNTLEENAQKKAIAHLEALRNANINLQGMIILGGLEIDALDGEPGIKVRRWIGRTMSDEEIINHCIHRLEGVLKEKRTARFRAVVAFAYLKDDSSQPVVEYFDGTLQGTILEKPDPLRIKGFPMESLFTVPTKDGQQILLGNIHYMSEEEKQKHEFVTHRARALMKVAERIKAFNC